MPSRSKQKGNAAEREVAKILSAWFGADFKRVPNSGALRWSGVSWVYGDLLPPEGFPGILESKHYAEIDLDGLLRLKPTDANPLGWWGQVVSDVKRCYEDTGLALQPILIFKANRRPRRIVLEECFFRKLYRESPPLRAIPYLALNRPEILGRVVIMDLEQFLGIVEPESFVHAAKLSFPTCLPQE